MVQEPFESLLESGDLREQRLVQNFDREKLLTGLFRACEKRPVPRRDLVSVVDAVESTLASRDVREMSTEEIGNMVIEELRRLDQVAYVRFASVYRRFEDVNQFMDELRKLLIKEKAD